jgi:hypothetical protein
MRDVCADFGAELAEFTGRPEHVQLLVNFPPAVAISRLVDSFIGLSSRSLRLEFPDLWRHYGRASGRGRTSPDRPAARPSLSCTGAGPWAPVSPLGPWVPVGPVGPGGPAAPVAPAGPAGPVAPGPCWFQEMAVVPFGQFVPASCSTNTCKR